MINLLTWLATYWIHSSLLLGGVALLTAFWVRPEAWRETLWKAALVGGVLTASLQFTLGIRPLVGRWKVPVETPPAAGFSGPASGHMYPTIRSMEREQTAPLAAGSLASRIPDEAGGPANPSPLHLARRKPPAWPAVVCGAWVLAAGWNLARVVHRHVRVRRLLRDRAEVTDPLTLAMLSRARRQAGVWRLVRLTSAPRGSTPFTLGVSEICLPRQRFDELGLDERRCAIAHELAHLVRRDPHWQVVTAVILSVFFFQPLNRLAARRIRASAEYLADDWAVRQTKSAIGLARSLAAVASWLAAERPEPQMYDVVLTQGGSPLIKRIQRLLADTFEPPPPGLASKGLATAAILAATIGTAPAITTGATAREPDGLRAAIAHGDVRLLDSADLERPLQARFASALHQAVRGDGGDAWIGYESRSALPPGRRHVSDSRRSGREQRGPAGLVLHSTRDRTWDALAPDLVVVVRVHAEPGGAFSVSRVASGTPSLEVDPGGLPLYWLAAAEDSESIPFLASLGVDAADSDVHQTLIRLIGVHGDSSIVVPYLSRVLADDYPMSVRAAAVDGLSWHPSSDVIDRLRAVALGDRSNHVRREAAEALGETGETAAVPALEEIVAASAAAAGTRAEAVEALGSFRKPEVLPVLTKIAFGADDSKRVQREAVDAVANSGLPEAVPVLKRIAVEHPVSSVRREALDELAEAGRPADLRVLFGIAMGDPDSRIQRLAVERIADFQLKDAAPFLENVAWEHASGARRREAVRLIGTMPKALGLPILEEIAANHPEADVRHEAAAAIARHRPASQEREYEERDAATPSSNSSAVPAEHLDAQGKW